MEYEKKTAVFKETEKGYSNNGKNVGGIARIETQSGISDLYVSLVNFSCNSDRLFLFLLDSAEKTFKFPFSQHSSKVFTFISPPDLKRGFSIGVVHVKDDIPLTIAFAKTADCPLLVSDFKKRIALTILNERKQSCCAQKKEEDYKSASKNNQIDVSPAKIYNDEAVATTNYYDFDEDIDKKLKTIEVLDNEKLQLKDELPFIRSQTQTDKAREGANGSPNETDFNSSAEYTAKNPFFQTILVELNEIFSSFPPEIVLQKIFCDSKFAKVYYSNRKYYVVGIIMEDGKEKYLCYGVPATYSTEPPKELKGFCSFIPLSVFDLKGDGYWMIFQDAISGKRIKPE